MKPRIAVIVAIVLVVAAWLVVVVRQVADGGFYSDDWAIQWDWRHFGYSEAVSRQFDILGSKPLLAIALPAPYEVFGANPAWHHVLAAALTLACVGTFYFVLRALRFAPRDAVPMALLALLFPWASAVRLWPAGSLNDLSVLLLFAGFLIALRGLRVKGRKGLLVHLAAAACYAASVLTYEVTTVLALFLWPAYIWQASWRSAWPRALMDISAVGAVAIYSGENTVKPIADLSDQLAHIPVMAWDGVKLIAASLVPVSVPAEVPLALTIAVICVALVALCAAVLRRRQIGDADGPPGGDWLAVGAVAVVALALCWAIYVPMAFYTPTFRGLEDRVNVLALYPAVVLVWAVLRAAGSLIPGRGYPVAIAGSIAILAGYWMHDFDQQRDWARSADIQRTVLAAIDRASPADRSLVLAFGYPAQAAPRVPVLNASWDLYPAAQLRTGREIQTYPAFAGARLRCGSRGLTIERLATPLYKTISLAPWGTPRTHPYPRVVFVDAADGRHAVIRSQQQCANTMRQYPLGPWLR